MSGDVMNGSAPAWLKAAVQLGVPAVLALGLVYYMTQTVDSKLTALQNQSQQHGVEYGYLKSAVTAHVDSTGRMNAEMLFYLRALCVQGAKTAGTDPRDCVPPREP